MSVQANNLLMLIQAAAGQLRNYYLKDPGYVFF